MKSKILALPEEESGDFEFHLQRFYALIIDMPVWKKQRYELKCRKAERLHGWQLAKPEPVQVQYLG